MNRSRFYAIRHWFRSLMPLADTRVGLTINDSGVVCSIHRCNSCGGTFTVTPKTDKVWGGCLAEGCPSYDSKRDMDKRVDNGANRDRPVTYWRRQATKGRAGTSIRTADSLRREYSIFLPTQLRPGKSTASLSDLSETEPSTTDTLEQRLKNCKDTMSVIG